MNRVPRILRADFVRDSIRAPDTVYLNVKVESSCPIERARAIIYYENGSVHRIASGFMNTMHYRDDIWIVEVTSTFHACFPNSTFYISDIEITNKCWSKSEILS